MQMNKQVIPHGEIIIQVRLRDHDHALMLPASMKIEALTQQRRPQPMMQMLFATPPIDERPPLKTSP